MNQPNIDDIQQKAIDDTARFIIKFGMTAPAILALESMRPLSFVGSQFMHVMSPAITAFLAPHAWDALAKLLEEREGMEYFIHRLEELDAQEERP